MEEWYTGASVGKWGQGVNSRQVSLTPHRGKGGRGHVCSGNLDGIPELASGYDLYIFPTLIKWGVDRPPFLPEDLIS
jgi:hypothetical protein